MDIWNAPSMLVLGGVVVVAAGLGWFTAQRRHPAYVFASGFLLLGVAGLTVATLPTVMTGWAASGIDQTLRSAVLLPRVSGIVAGAAVAYSLVAGVTALVAADDHVATRLSLHR